MGKFPYAVHEDTREKIYGDQLTKEAYRARLYKKLRCPFQGCPALLKFVHKKNGNFFWSIDITKHSSDCPYKTGYTQPPNEHNDDVSQPISIVHIMRSLKYAMKTYFFRKSKSKPGGNVPEKQGYTNHTYIHFAYANEINETYSGRLCSVGGIIRAIMINDADPSNQYGYIRFNVRGKYDVDAGFDKDFVRRYPHIIGELYKIREKKMDKQEDEDLVFICIGTVRVERTAIRVLVYDDNSFMSETGKKAANLLRTRYFLSE